MRFSRSWLSPLFLAALAGVAGVIWYAVIAAEPHQFLKVSFLDIGQGDSILIEGLHGTQVLIDGGSDRTVLRRLNEELPLFDRSIDVVLGTHPDKDHIGGLSYVLDRYSVAHMFHSGLTNDTAAQEAFMKAMHIEEETEGAQEHVTRRGTIIDMGDGAYLRILFPDRPMAGADTNTASAVVQLVYGDVEFMLTGDSPQQIEEYLVGLDGEGLASDVLKLGHHGSRTSSSQEFIETVSPKYAVISAGKNNSYGHPHKEVTDLMAREHVPTFVTFEKGTITFETDGKTLFVKN